MCCPLPVTLARRLLGAGTCAVLLFACGSPSSEPPGEDTASVGDGVETPDSDAADGAADGGGEDILDAVAAGPDASAPGAAGPDAPGPGHDADELNGDAHEDATTGAELPRVQEDVEQDATVVPDSDVWIDPCLDNDCDDSDACTEDTCQAGQGCVHTPIDCDDGDACNGVESCLPSSGCAPGAAPDCDDGELCTDDGCDAATGCVSTPGDGGCTDDNACTSDDCVAGDGCVFTDITSTCDDGSLCTIDGCDPVDGCFTTDVSYACDDNNACTDDSCEPEAGCVNLDVSASCDDDNACTEDGCTAAIGCTYVDTTALCADDDACTKDVCDPAVGCVKSPNDCDDDDACTDDDCNAESGCHHIDVSEACDDGSACTEDACDPTVGCTNQDITASCDDASLCTEDSCDPTLGCVNVDITSSCDDGDACTADTCTADEGCIHDPEGVCDDDDVCTDDYCDVIDGCSHVDMAYTCDDGSVCSLDDCDPEQGCTHIDLSPGCVDTNACNGTEWCDVHVGCVAEGGYVEAFEAGAVGWEAGPLSGAVSGWALTSESGGDAPAAFESIVFGTPNNGPELGEEHSFLMSPVFNLEGGGSLRFDSFTANEDNDPYDAETLEVSSNGGLTWTVLIGPEDPRWLNTGVWTTLEVDIPAPTASDAMRVRFVYQTFDDFGATEAVAGWYIDNFTTAPWALFDCDDGIGCTADTCHPQAGCQAEPQDEACDDGNACTTDVCLVHDGCLNEDISAACDDGDVCTLDVCDPDDGCTHFDISQDCADGDACTLDLCDSVTGCSSAPIDCDDGNSCNGEETCHVSAGCVSIAAWHEDFDSGALPWSHGIISGGVDGWMLTDTTGGSAPVTFASTAYGTANTGPQLGHEHSYLESPSYDLTAGGTVGFRAFLANEPNDPYDAESLEISGDNGATWAVLIPSDDARWAAGPGWTTISEAVPADLGTFETRFRIVYDTGDDFGGPEDVVGLFIDDFVVTPQLGPDCDDGVECTVDTCQGSGEVATCIHDGQAGCDDGELCTLDACDTASDVCLHVPDEDVCDDGDPCTVDSCESGGGGCAHSGSGNVCDDGDACTADSCDPVLGCQHVNLCGACGDGMCTGFENCEICPEDCCEAQCGNGACDGIEYCATCPVDCGPCGTLDTGGTCCSAQQSTGCSNDWVESCVCAQDPFCCTTQWDSLCSAAAASACGLCGGDPGDCCTVKAQPGCNKDAIESCVCAQDPYCCNTEWDAICAGEAANPCGGSCD